MLMEKLSAEEDKIGKPFVGAAGQLLNKMLDAIMLNRKKVYITNVIPWNLPIIELPQMKKYYNVCHLFKNILN